MSKRAVVEIKCERWAKMQLLTHRADLSDKEMQDRITGLKLDLGRWPVGKKLRQRGIAACGVLKDRLPMLLETAGLDANAEKTPENLYRYVFESDLDYWALAKQLDTDHLTREWLAMEGGVCRYVIWPKHEAQFFFATHLPRAINDVHDDCIAILGSFIVEAAQEQPARVKDASSYYLLGSGELKKRETWGSQKCGFDEEHFMMAYELDLTALRRYTGLISIARDKGQTPIIDKGRYRGTRCFKGQIFTLGDSDYRPGPFVAEEMRVAHRNISEEMALLNDKTVQTALLKRLDISEGACRYCANGGGLPADKCGFLRVTR